MLPLISKEKKDRRNWHLTQRTNSLFPEGLKLLVLEVDLPPQLVLLVAELGGDGRMGLPSSSACRMRRFFSNSARSAPSRLLVYRYSRRILWFRRIILDPPLLSRASSSARETLGFVIWAEAINPSGFVLLRRRRGLEMELGLPNLIALQVGRDGLAQLGPFVFLVGLPMSV